MEFAKIRVGGSEVGTFIAIHEVGWMSWYPGTHEHMKDPGVF